MRDEQYLYRPPVQLRPRRGLPTWAWVIVALGGAALFQMTSAALLILAFGPHRIDAPHACLERVRQLSQALSMYTRDYDYQLPPAQSWIDATAALVRSDDAYR